MAKGVITGDIVNSTLISNEWKSAVFTILEQITDDFKSLTNANFEMFRGDSFQVVVDNVSHALSFGIAIRAALRAKTPPELEWWDARISIGIGDVSYKSGSILTSDGEAFRLSGREFDVLNKRRLSIITPFDNINDELKLTTSFADEFIAKWTPKQAEIIYPKLYLDITLTDLASMLNMKIANVSKHWNSAHGALILSYIERYKELITRYYDK